MDSIPQVKPLREIKGNARLSVLQMAFEAEYRNRLVRASEGAGRARGPGMKPGWIHGLSNVNIDPNDLALPFYSIIADVAEPGQELVNVLFNRIGPSGYLDWHVDGEPYRERWHYILFGHTHYYQNPLDEIIHGVQQKPGYWYGPISYWVPHALSNNDQAERIAMLIDLEPIA